MKDSHALVQNIAILSMILVAAVALIYGAKQRWMFLVDPPEWLWLCYSQAFLKKVLGLTFVLAFTYIVGFLLLIVAVVGLWQNLVLLGQGLGWWGQG